MKKPKAYLLLILLILLFLLNTASCSRHTPPPTLQPGGYERTLTLKGQSRSYLLYVPTGVDTSRAVPVVFGFHGYGGNGLRFQNATGFNTLADTYKFLVVYPEGEVGDHSWNAGGCCGNASMTDLDDIAFIRQILSDLKTIATLDPKRIYATGHSNGGMFVYRLACEMSDTFAAVAPVAGPLFLASCEPKQPVSVLHVHGLADTTVPYTGGSFPGYPSLVFPSVEGSMATWARLNGCSGEVQLEEKEILTHKAYPTCQDGATVELYAIQGLDHSWPQPEVWPASQTIWEFFAAHPKP